MRLPVVALAGLEQALNALLQLDPDANKRLAALHGQSIGIELQGLGLTLFFIADDAGRVQILGELEGEADALISGSPLDLIRATDSGSGSAKLFAGDMQISGDTELAHRFGAILGGLDIDWEEQLSRLIGDIAAHQLGNGARNLGSYARESSNTIAVNLGEYVTEEARLLPPRLEAAVFLRDVDTLRDDTERLAARIGILRRQAGKQT